MNRTVFPHRIFALICAALTAGPAALAVEKVAPLVPAYAMTDKYVTSPTMLVRSGADGLIREIWSGMDTGRMRHVPLFLETAIHAEALKNGAWLDLRTLPYSLEGTRPGYVHLRSADGFVTIEFTARSKAAVSPVFVRYHFSEPVQVRIEARLARPQFTQAERSDDASGLTEFTTSWRDQNAVLTTTGGPKLRLSTLPLGRTVSLDASGTLKELPVSSEVILAIDATEYDPPSLAEGSTVEAWKRTLGGFKDTAEEHFADRVRLSSDDPKLDRLFEYSIDSIQSHQFASGDVMADLFFYRDSWIRDGTYTMIGLALAGDYADVDRYFAYWDTKRDSYVGGEREAQQPAIALTGMWLFSRLSPSGDAFLRKRWSYVSYYCDYYTRRVDTEGLLNVAEEWICFIPSPSSWPNAEIYSGLRAGAKIAAATGHPEEAAKWTRAADKLQREFAAVAFDTPTQKFIPMAGKPGEVFRDPEYPQAESRNGPLRDDRTDSGMLMLARMEAFGKGQGVVSVDDPHFASTQAAIRRDLENPDHSIFRFGPNPSSPHAPQGELDTWPINTAWAAQDEWLLGRTGLAWMYLLSGDMNKSGYDLAAGTYYLPENWDQNGVIDKPMIVWSHGDFVTSALLLFLGLDLEPGTADLGLAPSLPPGMNHASLSNFRFRNWRMDLSLSRKDNQVEVSVRPFALGASSPRPEALKIRAPFGRILEARPGETLTFTVDPSLYYLAFGRDAHPAERAKIASQVLTGKPPARDPASMTRAELETFMLGIETAYVPTAH